MAINQEWINDTMAEFAKACPLAANDPEAVEALKAKVLKYDELLGTPPPIGTILSLARPYETALQQKRDDAAKAEQEARDRINARRQARADFLSDAGVSREAMIRDLSERNKGSQTERPGFTPRRAFTNQELDAMDSETYKREVLGVEDWREGLNKQATSSTEPELLRRKTHGVEKMSEATRTKLQAEKVRARGVEADKRERQKLAAELRSALGGKK